ncbi:sigma intracellular receptor 2-like [Halichondria panicea]|uniref:sigma intracellular receptor 2-like n=1 Tax=Halichondria panicea TaxID=6063 RepID=UPI00312BB455
MASILRRPLDLLIIVFFIFFVLIAWTIDFTQSLYGSVLALEDIDEWIWPPAIVLKYYAWWCETYDPLVAHNPMWYETMAWFSPFLYTPFYICAIYAFIYEKEWIRIPALLWAYGLLLTMFVVVREQLMGEHATPNVPIFFAAYSTYIIVPALVMLRVARAPVFSSGAKNKRD